MLKFPQGYFEKEERNGFVVSEVMKRVWASQLEMLYNVIKVCEKHNITYYMYWGTLIGTIRHHGYIPWDDDVDIAMKRDDYIKFLEVVENEVPGYIVNNVYTKEDCRIYFTRLTNGCQINFSTDFLNENYNCPFVIGIDVFPLYYLPRDVECMEELKGILAAINQLINVADYYKEDAWKVPELVENLNALEQLCGMKFIKGRSISNQLFMLYDQLCRSYGDDEADFITAFPEFMSSGYKVDKKLFETTLSMPYEFIDVTVPIGYDAILRQSFGNYMTPVRGTAAHNYPYFKGQLKDITDNIEEINKEFMQMDPLVKGTELLGGSKKTVLYYCNPHGILLHTEAAIQKIEHTLEVFKNNKNVVLWFIPYDITLGRYPIAGTMAPDTTNRYREMLSRLKDEDWYICDMSGDYSTALNYCDALYGDAGELADMFIDAGKPVMYQNYEIIQ